MNGAKKYDSMQVAPNGKSVMEEDSAMGKFGLQVGKLLYIVPYKIVLKFDLILKKVISFHTNII